MKIKILALSLIFSLLLNAAGIVFFILYLNTQGKYHGAKRQKRQMERYLDAIAVAKILGQPSAEERIQKRNFVSRLDGNPDVFGFIPPAVPCKNCTLVVYLHGMGSSYVEPFIVPHGDPIADRITSCNPSSVFMSCGYRGSSSWGNDAALSDITQNIHEVCAQYPVEKIVLMGTSMGGCTALMYAELAPQDIKDRIVGVVSVESAGDLAQLYNECRGKAVGNAIFWAFGGAPAQVPEVYEQHCFIHNLQLLPARIRITVVSAKADTVVLPHFQHEIVEALQSKKYAVQLIEVEGAHGAPPSEIYARGFDEVSKP